MNIKLDVLLVQLIHIGLLFRLFKTLIGNSLVDAITARKEQISKLKNAEGEYDRLMAEAKAEKDSMIAQALTRKKEILEEAKEVAGLKVHEIIAQANHEAEQIKKESEHVYLDLHEELVNRFEEMVKNTASVGLKKLIGSKTELHQQYLDEVLPQK